MSKEGSVVKISFEQCSYVILEKTYNIASRPKMIAVSCYRGPKNVPKMIKRGYFFIKLRINKIHFESE